MKAIILGGAGFIGSHVVDSLLKDGYEVMVIDNLERGNIDNIRHCLRNVTFIRADLRHDLSSLAIADQDTVIFDFAAKVFGVRHLYAEPWTLMIDNLQIVMNNLKRWSGAGKYVYTSSSCVYDWEDCPLPHKEEDMGFLNSFYGWSKMFGELCFQALDEEKGLNYVILRPFNVYGERESFVHPHVIPDFVKKACDCKYRGAKSFEILGDGEQTRSFTYVSDIVEGVRLAAERGGKSAYNLSNPVETRIIDLAETMFSVMDIKPDVVYSPAPEQEVKKRCGSSEKALRELGWSPKVGLREGLERTLRWMVPLIEKERK